MGEFVKCWRKAIVYCSLFWPAAIVFVAQRVMFVHQILIALDSASIGPISDPRARQSTATVPHSIQVCKNLIPGRKLAIKY